MWTILGVSFTASLITLKSMRSLLNAHIPRNNQPASQTETYNYYLILLKEHLDEILTTLINQMKHTRGEVTIEILFLPGGQAEFIIYVPSSIQFAPHHQQALLPLEALWSEQYTPDYVVDDSDSIYNSVLAHQIILKSKTHNIAFVTSRSVKRTPANYRINGIDEFKWKQFVQKQSDTTPDLIPHERIYNLIQEKAAIY